ncbi:Uncharacterized protein FKW44_020721, partial [Caligus rogercresseyi]
MKEKHLQCCQALINNLKSSWPRTCGPPEPQRQPLDYAFWPHIEFKACKLRHPNIAALKPPSTKSRPDGRGLRGQGLPSFQEAPHGHRGRQQR